MPKQIPKCAYSPPVIDAGTAWHLNRNLGFNFNPDFSRSGTGAMRTADDPNPSVIPMRIERPAPQPSFPRKRESSAL